MKKIEKEPETPVKPAVPPKSESAPEKEEEERARYYSPPCMMGELGEIMDE